MDFLDRFRERVNWSKIFPWFVAALALGIAVSVLWTVCLLKAGGDGVSSKQQQPREEKVYMSNLKYAVEIARSFVGEHWGYYAVQGVLILAAVPVFTILLSSVAARLTEEQSKSNNENRKLGAWHIFTFVLVLSMALRVLRSHLREMMIPRATAIISAELFERYLKNYETSQSETDEALGDVLYTIRQVTADLTWVVTYWLTDIITIVVMLGVLTIYMSTVKLSFGVASLVFSLAIIGVGVLFNLRIVQKVIRFFNSERKILARGEQYVVNAATITAFNARSEIQPDLRQYTDQLVRIRRDFTNTETGYFTVWRVLIVCFFAFVMYGLIRGGGGGAKGAGSSRASGLTRSSMQTLMTVLFLLLYWLLDISADMIDMTWRIASVANIYSSDLFNDSRSSAEDSMRDAAVQVSPDTPFEIRNMGFRYDEVLARAGRATQEEAEEILLEHAGAAGAAGAAGWTVAPFTLVAKPSDMIVIKGKSGAGKSTLLKLMAGFETPTVGEVRLGDGTSTSVKRSVWRRHVLFVSQKWSLFNGSVLDNMLIGSGVSGIDSAQMNAFLAHFGLDAIIPDVGQKAGNSAATGGGQMSGGMGKIIVLCRAFLRTMPQEMLATFFAQAKRSHPVPHVVLFDEPLSALDESTRNKVARLIRTAKHPSCIAFFIMHNDDMDSHATRILEIQQGKVSVRPHRGQASSEK
jgi:ABC-type bacteriocin/lantibiotic exporter with double-glycine peptidase domain